MVRFIVVSPIFRLTWYLPGSTSRSSSRDCGLPNSRGLGPSALRSQVTLCMPAQPELLMRRTTSLSSPSSSPSPSAPPSSPPSSPLVRMVRVSRLGQRHDQNHEHTRKRGRRHRRARDERPKGPRPVTAYDDSQGSPDGTRTLSFGPRHYGAPPRFLPEPDPVATIAGELPAGFGVNARSGGFSMVAGLYREFGGGGGGACRSESISGWSCWL